SSPASFRFFLSLFFFSSRRRHTRSKRDWSSDVCSSDLFPLWFIIHCIGRLSHLPFVRMTCGNGYYYFTMIVNIIGLILGFLMILNPILSFLSVGYIIAIYLLILGIDGVIFSFVLLN